MDEAGQTVVMPPSLLLRARAWLRCSSEGRARVEGEASGTPAPGARCAGGGGAGVRPALCHAVPFLLGLCLARGDLPSKPRRLPHPHPRPPRPLRAPPSLCSAPDRQPAEGSGQRPGEAGPPGGVTPGAARLSAGGGLQGDLGQLGVQGGTSHSLMTPILPGQRPCDPHLPPGRRGRHRGHEGFLSQPLSKRLPCVCPVFIGKIPCSLP